MAKTLEQHFHEEGTGGYPLRTILDNLTDEEIEDSVKNLCEAYAIEAIKADRERVASNAKTIKTGNSGSFFDASVDRQSIVNLPIELT